jgi:ADP-heptose:LPS heptosyltransferase
MRDARYPAVLFCNGIGDHLLNLPALRALAALFPARLTLVCQRGAKAVFFADVAFRAVFEVDMTWTEKGWLFDADEVARKVTQCDLLISLNPWHTDAVDQVLNVLSPAHSIGFFPSFEICVVRDYSKHSADLAFDIPRVFDPSLRLERFAAPPRFPAACVRQAARIRRMVPSDASVLTVHTDTKPEKMWPRSRFVRVLEAFLERHPDFIVFAVGQEQLEPAVDGADRGIVSCHGLPVSVAMSLVAGSDLFLGVDSSMLHAADLFRVPAVGLFGPTNAAEWGCRFSESRHVCGDGSMEAIEEPAVLEALEDLCRRMVRVSTRPPRRW